MNTQNKSGLFWKPKLGRYLSSGESNIVIFQLAAQYSADDLISYLQAQDIHAFHIGNNQVRLVFHMDVSADMTGKLVRMLSHICSECCQEQKNGDINHFWQQSDCQYQAYTLRIPLFQQSKRS